MSIGLIILQTSNVSAKLPYKLLICFNKLKEASKQNSVVIRNIPQKKHHP